MYIDNDSVYMMNEIQIRGDINTQTAIEKCQQNSTPDHEPSFIQFSIKAHVVFIRIDSI